VIIEGFKSYKDQTSTELFSNNINVVAIRFVLNDLFTTLRQEDRERLLHEGAGNAVTSAYVELVFDNSDGRLPIDSREVRLRRSIGLKKDEYQLNKRVVTKAHVMSLLETAGFSRANPYYVVQQGKIMAMANMKDGERLELLKEIGGTRVYEERRRESEKLMAECETKRETIQGLAEKAEALQRRAALELDVRELERGIAGTKAEQAELNKGLDLVSSDIRIKRAELASLDARLAGAVEEEGAAAAALAGREARQQALFAKQGQRARYATAAERDEALTKEIRALEGALTTKHETQAAAERQAAACATEAEALEEEVEAARSGLADLERDLAATAGRVHALSQRRDAAVNRQKELWGAEAELDGSWRLKAEELARVSRVLEAATPRDLVRGLEAVERLVREHGIRGVHGTLLDLFDIDAHPGHATAVEVTAGNNLFYVVVDDDGVATQLTQLLTSQRAGRATFMPLNRLRATEAPRPDQYGDAVFGKTLVCRDLAAAARVARETDSEAEGLRQTIAGDLLRHQQARALFLCKGGDLDLEDRLAGRTLAVDEPTLEARRTALATVEAELARTYADEKAVADELELLVGRRPDTPLARLVPSSRQEKESAGGTALEAAREALSRALLALEDVQLNEQEAQAKRGALEAKLGDLDDRMRLLRPVSADAVEVHATTSLSALRAQLGKMNAELHSKYRPANRLALEQHQGFREQRDELVRRKEDNDEGERKIRQLISTLDMRKDEALERTFKGVAKNFRDIFATLVPGGRGEVVMQKRVPGFGNEENIDPEAGKPSTGLDRYVGVRVKVTEEGVAFGAGGETMSLRQLSGGQKTLVALTLIFAIQVPRCDPAPFYLFDEIDAALDPQYRTVVADLLRAQSRDVHQRAQFIVTTFHPQLVAVADRVYAVSHSNRVSRVDLIRHEEAMGFLKAQGDTAGEAREVSLVA
ncbi:hypothetical protein APUTEX25_004565, partial [Auxenochlorella protothecoides]